MPEAFLKRWILSRNSDKNVTAETIEKEWADTYLPSLKWELLDNSLNKIQSIEPTQNEIVDYVKDILRNSSAKQEDEDDAKYDVLFKEKVNPDVEKVSSKDFNDIARQQ